MLASDGLDEISRQSQPAQPTLLLVRLAIAACGSNRKLDLRRYLEKLHGRRPTHGHDFVWLCLASVPDRNCLVGEYKGQGSLAHVPPFRY